MFERLKSAGIGLGKAGHLDDRAHGIMMRMLTIEAGVEIEQSQATRQARDFAL
jgi:hypothetical protein